MIVTPAPVGLLVVLVKAGEVAIPAMVLFRIHAIGSIFMIARFVIVIVLFVMVVASGFAILGW